jgi:hypothetical protein
MTEVLEGLAAGDSVIVAGQALLEMVRRCASCRPWHPMAAVNADDRYDRFAPPCPPLAPGARNEIAQARAADSPAGPSTVPLGR